MDSFPALSQAEIISAIHHANIFSGIDIIEQKMLADKSVIEIFATDEIVIEQGEIGDKLYIIMQGRIEVSIKDLQMGRKRIAVLGPNDVFGEIAIIRSIPRTARISTLTPCRFLTINAEDFMKAYQYFPARARDNIQLVIAKRLQELSSVH